MGAEAMFTDRLRQVLQPSIDALADLLARFGLTPNGLTIIGASLHLLVLWALAQGDFLLGAALMVVASGLDGIDGTLARRTGHCTDFGAFLDSSLDRVSEILIFLGLLIHAQAVPAAGGASAIQPALVYAALTGSLMVSYTRARAEGAGLPARGGIFTRLERMAVLWLGLVSGWLLPALWIIAVGAWLTAAQRVLEAWQLSRAESALPSAEAGASGSERESIA